METAARLVTGYSVSTFTSRLLASSSGSQSTRVILGCLHGSSNTLQTFHKRTGSTQQLTVISNSRLFHTSIPLSAKPKFSYGIAASFTPKHVRYNPEKNVIDFNPKTPSSTKRKEKTSRPDSGQDSFFISSVGGSNDIAIGVADGVGGWADSGVDPADFSHAFCEYMAYMAHENTKHSAPLTARYLMQKGYDEVVADSAIAAGGSTACVAIAKDDGSLDVANLGDSGFLQLRLNAVHNFSHPQTHGFNTPYQLSVIPSKMKAKSAVFGGSHLQDFPKDAMVSRHSLRHGDVLVFATDGLWDNLTSSDILRIVSRLMISARAWEHTDGGIRVTDRLQSFTQLESFPEDVPDIPSLQSFLAVAITGEAKAASVNSKVDSPFAREVQRYYPEENYKGGKEDDICVVVAIVVEDGLTP